MGTWGSGLMEGDGPLDYLGDLKDQVEEDIAEYAKDEPSEATAARVGAAIGLLLQFSAYSFELEFFRTLKKAISRHSQGISALPEGARKVLAAVAAGEGLVLAEGSRVIDEPVNKVLGSRWGKDTRQAALFQHPEAAGYVQSFAERCADVIDEGFQGDDLDLYQVDFMGAFGLLLIIEPFQLDEARIVGWRESLRGVHEQTKTALSKPINEANLGDLPVFEEYMAKAEQAFELVLAKVE